MTATITTISTIPSTRTAEATTSIASKPALKLWRTGGGAGLAAAAGTMVVAAIAHAGGVSLETEPGQAIPVLGFGTTTLFFTAVGVLIAIGLARFTRRPHGAFVATTVVLTVLSFGPDLALSTDAGTKLTLVLTHVVAAAIVIPALAGRLPERRLRRA